MDGEYEFGTGSLKLIESQLIESMFVLASKLDWNEHEINKAQEGIRRILFILEKLYNESCPIGLSLESLSYEIGEELVNYIVFSLDGETINKLSDLVLLSMLLSVFKKYVAIESWWGGEYNSELSLTDAHVNELWPWDKLF